MMDLCEMKCAILENQVGILKAGLGLSLVFHNAGPENKIKIIESINNANSMLDDMINKAKNALEKGDGA